MNYFDLVFQVAWTRNKEQNHRCFTGEQSWRSTPQKVSQSLLYTSLLDGGKQIIYSLMQLTLECLTNGRMMSSSSYLSGNVTKLFKHEMDLTAQSLPAFLFKQAIESVLLVVNFLRML